MQLSNLRPLPFKKHRQTRYSFNKWGGKSLRWVHSDEKENVLQHENQNYQKDFLHSD